MTGTRFSVILQGLSATIAALIVSFIVGWKLTLVVLCFAPLMMLTGLLQGKKQNDIAQSKDKGSLVEQGGQVQRVFTFCFVLIDLMFSMQQKQSNIFEQLWLFIKKNILFIFMKISSIKNFENKCGIFI